MAEIIEQGADGARRGRPKKQSTHIDMTPMVDLACLLITFFMLTTAFSKPKVMEIVLPEKPDENIEQTKIPDELTYNLLLAENNKVFWYRGDIKNNPKLEMLDYSDMGLRKFLIGLNQELYVKIEQLEDELLKGNLIMSDAELKATIKAWKKQSKKSPIVLVKATDKAKYRNLVDVIDEMSITSIPRYAIVDITTKEMELIAENQKY